MIVIRLLLTRTIFAGAAMNTFYWEIKLGNQWVISVFLEKSDFFNHLLYLCLIFNVNSFGEDKDYFCPCTVNCNF